MMNKAQKEDHLSNTLHIYYKEITNVAFQRERNMTKIFFVMFLIIRLEKYI